MLNIILLSFTCFVFYGGFVCGAKYKTTGEFYRAVKAKISSLF